jgi:hypothetical protein
MSVTPFLQSNLDPMITNTWHKLSTWFKNDDPTTFKTMHHGMSVWYYAACDPKFNNLFNGLESLVDVGGGTAVQGPWQRPLLNHFQKWSAMYLISHMIT